MRPLGYSRAGADAKVASPRFWEVPMQKTLLLSTSASLVLALALAGFISSPAEAQGAAALAGQVTSAKEGAMEGVVVTAKKDGSTIAVSVVSDKAGRYSFPAARLEPGHYSLKIRAVGYDLESGSAADVKAGATTAADIKLAPTKNLALQLTNAEWLASAPGTDEQKKFVLSCNSCHSYQRIVNSTHTPDEFMQVFDRMAGLLPRQHAAAAAAADRNRAAQSRRRRRQRDGRGFGRAHEGCGGLARQHQSEQRA
jgi:hypothetical protein